MKNYKIASIILHSSIFLIQISLFCRYQFDKSFVLSKDIFAIMLALSFLQTSLSGLLCTVIFKKPKKNNGNGKNNFNMDSNNNTNVGGNNHNMNFNSVNNCGDNNSDTQKRDNK